MNKFAIIESGFVIDVVSTESDAKGRGVAVEIPSQSTVCVGWTYDGKGFAPAAEYGISYGSGVYGAV